LVNVLRISSTGYPQLYGIQGYLNLFRKIFRYKKPQVSNYDRLEASGRNSEVKIYDF
jgi:hypothetical protein